MAWSPQQAGALRAVDAWLKNRGGPQIFRLFGFAGSGKTTIAKTIADGAAGRVLFAAYTGKAAFVLRSKGCGDASTIHGLIYKVEEGAGGKPHFVRNRDSLVRSAALVIIDECSFVDEEVGRDLLSFGVKVLVLGDTAQLPPVKGAGFFINAQPDVLLTEIHRQAADNPIIRMSMEVREGRRLQLGTYGDCKVVRRADVVRSEVQAADIVLCGLNKSRRAFNYRLRELGGVTDPLPVDGDRLICLRNNRDKGLFNGQIWTASAVSHSNCGRLTSALALPDTDDPSEPTEITVPVEFFDGTEKNLSYGYRREFDEFDYGRAITVHKSQGSQWRNVMLFDESSAFREDRDKHLYTGITRAAEKLTVVV